MKIFLKQNSFVFAAFFSPKDVIHQIKNNTSSILLLNKHLTDPLIVSKTQILLTRLNI